MGDILGKLLFLVLTVLIARNLGAANYGKFSFAITFPNLFLIFSDLGLTILMIREVARNKQETEKFISNVMIMKAVLSVLTWGIVFMLINLMKYPEDTKYAVYILTLSLLINSFIEAFGSIFRAYEEMGYVAFLMVFQKAACTLLGVAALFAGLGLKGVVNAYFLATLITGIIGYVILRNKFVKPVFHIDIDYCKKILHSALPVGMSIFFSIVYFRIDTVLLSIMKGDTVVGWYNAAYKPMEALMVIPAAFMGALFPVFSNLYKNSRETLLFMCEKTIKILLIIILPIAVGTTIFAEKIVILFYGSGFESSIIALRILIWASVIIYVNYVLTQLLIVINKQKFNAIFTILCAAFNIGLNLVFIPKLSYIGSGVITVGTEILLFVLCFFAVSRCMGIIPLHRIIIKPVLASIILGLALIIAADAPLFLAILIAAVVYVGAVKLIRIIDKDDHDILKSIFKVKTYEVSEK